MSMTKRAMEADREAAEKTERDRCGCVYNWDDKFWQECPEHAAETNRRTEEEERDFYE